MGFVKKESMTETVDGKPCTIIGDYGFYHVIKDSEHMTGIYVDYGSRLLTSKPKWSQAIKLAKLLNEAYMDGYNDAKSDYR